MYTIIINLDYYKPKPRRGHSSIVVGNKLYSWLGLPRGHDSAKKDSSVDVLHLDTGIWHNMPTTGDFHSGIQGYACTTIGNNLLFFGGYCGHDDCYHSNTSQLDSSTLIWSNLVCSDDQFGPMKKAYCGILSFTCSEGHDYLFIIGGQGPPPRYRQDNAEYCELLMGDSLRTNEQHLYNISTG